MEENMNGNHRNRNGVKFYDDGTNTFFWRAHTVTVLFLLICPLVYITLFEDTVVDRSYNTKRGLVACLIVFLCFGVTQAKDGPFTRPHPALWRFVLCISVVYELALIFILFQTADDARGLMVQLDDGLGEPLPETSYGGNCLLYDPENSDPFHNIWDKCDEFIPAHIFGWFAKTLMLRDPWFCFVLSILFELSEYSLEHQLPNFSECWWDHWILDLILCNGFGMYLGMITLHHLELKTYEWRGLWNIPTYKGKMRRLVAQFSPYFWTEFHWRPTESLKRWFAVSGIALITLIAELNSFYLKFNLWLPPPHYVNILRLVVLAFCGAVAYRECYQYLDDKNCHKLGQQAWITAMIIVTEFLIIIKFDVDTLLLPVPGYVLSMWAVGLIGYIGFTVWYFIFPTFKIVRRGKRGGRNKEMKDRNANLTSKSSRTKQNNDHGDGSVVNRRQNRN